MNRLLVAPHLSHRTAFIAEAISEQIPAFNHVEAPLADHPGRLVTQQRLGRFVPDRDAPGLIAGVSGDGSAGQQILRIESRLRGRAAPGHMPIAFRGPVPARQTILQPGVIQENFDEM